MDEEKKSKAGLYDKYYKLLLLIPVSIFILSIVYLVSFYSENNDIIIKDVTLTGGTTFTLFTEKQVNINDIESKLSQKLGDISARVLTELSTGKQVGISIESKSGADEMKKEVENYFGYTMSEDEYTIEFTGSTLSESFYNELIMALAIAFVLMAMVVFFIFRVPIPCLAVVFAAAMDIVVTVAVIDIIGFRVSTAGIAAFLMLIGYSVDTDILLSTRVLKRGDKTVNNGIFEAFKTGITMSLTSFIAVFIAYFIVFSSVLKEVFLILSIGLLVDIVSTWLGNAAFLKWYCDRKHAA